MEMHGVTFAAVGDEDGVRARTRMKSVADWFVMSDPGWGRAQMGWRTLVSLVAGLAAGYGMARGLGQPALMGTLFGGLIGFIGGLQVPDGPIRAVAGDLSWYAPSFATALLASMIMAPHRLAALSLLVVTVFLKGYLERFGRRGSYVSTMLFATYVAGILLPIPIHLYPRCVAIALASVAACILARTVLCRYSPARDLRETRRAWLAACRSAAASVEEVLLNPETGRRRLLQDLNRVNTMALILDGRLGHESVDGQFAEHLHRRVFDVEQALVSLAELCQALAEEPPSAAQDGDGRTDGSVGCGPARRWGTVA
jgi:hypothetical protein